jgi:uncharacterized protein involved in exopolysaccharide biosynthesis
MLPRCSAAAKPALNTTTDFHNPPSQATAPIASFDEEPLSLDMLVGFVFRRRVTALAVLALVTSLAVALALLLPRQYRAETVATVVDGDDARAALAALGSRTLTRAFIDEENLLPELFHQSFDEQAGQWKVDYPSDIPTLDDGYDLFDRRVRQVVERDDGLVVLSVEWRDPELAARWANLLIERVNRTLREDRLVETERSIAYLNQALQAATTAEVRMGIHQLVTEQTNEQLRARLREDYAFRVVDRAVPSSPDDFVKPDRALIIVLGVFLGMFLGISLAWLVDRLAPHRH